jgi:hypothetical protein
MKPCFIQTLIVFCCHITNCDTGTSSGDEALCEQLSFSDKGLPSVDDSGDCPGHPEMSLIPGQSSCIDLYEASHGSNGGAVSVPGELPWTDLTFDQAGSACGKAGKRICEGEEWEDSCTAGQTRKYPYGDSYKVDACNVNGVMHALPTGAMPDCRSAAGEPTDLVGNVCEFVAPMDGEIRAPCRGGMYFFNGEENDCHEYGLVDPDDSNINFGFRCCLSLVDAGE